MNQPAAAAAVVDCLPAVIGPLARHPTRQVTVRWGGREVRIGGDAPVMVQSMTNTDTAGRDRHRDPGEGTGPGRQRSGAHHRQLA
jgi:hypothetical protein